MANFGGDNRSFAAGAVEPVLATNVTDYTAILSGDSWNGALRAGVACIVTYLLEAVHATPAARSCSPRWRRGSR